MLLLVKSPSTGVTRSLWGPTSREDKIFPGLEDRREKSSLAYSFAQRIMKEILVKLLAGIPGFYPEPREGLGNCWGFTPYELLYQTSPDQILLEIR